MTGGRVKAGSGTLYHLLEEKARGGRLWRSAQARRTVQPRLFKKASPF